MRRSWRMSLAGVALAHGINAICCSELQCKQLKIEQIRHEMALLKRWSLARAANSRTARRSLLDETHS